MRFMIIRRADKDTEAGVMPTQDVLTAMLNYNEELVKAGVLLAGDGLHPSSKRTLVSFRNGKSTITDGPFAETKELIAGFTIIQVKSKEEALEWVKRWPEPNVDLELSPIFEADDFGDEFTPELREAEERMRAEVAAKQAR